MACLVAASVFLWSAGRSKGKGGRYEFPFLRSAKKGDTAAREAAARDWVERFNAGIKDEKQYRALVLEMRDFDAVQMKAAIKALMEDSEADLSQRMFIARLLLSILSGTDPDGTVRFFENDLAGKGDAQIRASLFGGILDGISERDPAKAAGYFKSHNDLWADAGERNRAAQELLYGPASIDPGRALGMIGKMGDVDPVKSVRTAFSSRPIELGLIREFVAKQSGSMSDGLLRGGFGLYGEQMVGQSFSAAVAQIDSAHLSAEEMLAVARGVSGQDRTGDIRPGREMNGEQIPVDYAKWLGWLENHLPAEEYSDGAARMAEQWAKQDPNAAENWINSLPDGGSKLATITAFVNASATVDPDRATRLVMSLPEADRGNLLSVIQKAAAGE